MRLPNQFHHMRPVYWLSSGLIAVPLVVPLSVAFANPNPIDGSYPIDGKENAQNVEREIIEETGTKQSGKQCDGETSERKTIIIRKIAKSTEGKEQETVEEEHKVIIKCDDNLSEEDREAIKKEIDEALTAVDLNRKDGKPKVRITMIELDDEKGSTRVKVNCAAGEAETWTDNRGRKVRICDSDIETSGLTGLKAARETFAGYKNLDDEMRIEILAQMDAKIAEAEKAAQE